MVYDPTAASCVEEDQERQQILITTTIENLQYVSYDDAARIQQDRAKEVKQRMLGG